jgi:hypothetical protein
MDGMLWPHELPTHLGVEDRVLGPFTMRQVLILLSGASAAYEGWGQLPAGPLHLRAAFALGAIALTLATALLRPGGRRMEVWVVVMARFAVLPKRSLWRPRSPARAGVATRASWADHAPALAWPVSTPTRAGAAVRTAAVA